jgi:hypothetical protein
MAVPGKQSWNWHSIRPCHISSSSFLGYLNVLSWIEAYVDRSSRSCSRISQLRLCSLVRAWVVYTPRCSSKYSSPYHVTRLDAFSSRRSKNWSTVAPEWTRGMTPTVSAMPRRRRSRSRCCHVGPPPPSPLPNCDLVSKALCKEQAHLQQSVQCCPGLATCDW